MESETLSVIVPVYNASQYLKGCLDSILSQTYHNLEIIIIDDGSTDNSAQICDLYARKDPRVFVIHQKNGGTVAARQKGLTEAKGKYTGFVDADDWIEPGMFTYMVSKIQETKSDLIQIQMFGRKAVVTDCELVELQKPELAEVIRKRIFTDGSLMPNFFSKLFITEKIKDALSKVPPKQQFGEDLLCLLHYLNASNKICMSGQQFYHYRVLEGSVSRKLWYQMCVETTGLYGEVKKTLEGYGQWDVCQEGVSSYYRSLLFEYLDNGFQEKNAIERYRFKNVSDLMNKQIVLYGAGKVGSDYYKQIVCNEKQKIVAWIDKSSNGSAVQSPECLKEFDYDYILIAVAKEEVAEEIRKSLLDSGLCDDPAKIIWREPERLW